MIIYKATNKINGKVYIGQTIKTLQQRQTKHISDAKNGGQCYFASALRKYGINGFTWEEVCCCFDMTGLNEMEVYFIKLHDSFNTGYNMTSGGENYIRSEETKEKIRHVRLGTKLSDITKRRISNNHAKHWLGKKRSEKTKQRMHQSALNKPIVSEETKIKIGLANFGKKISDVTRKKMSKAHKGKKFFENTKQKMSKAHTGHNNPNYGKRGKETSMFGRHHSEETKEKMRQAAFNRPVALALIKEERGEV